MNMPAIGLGTFRLQGQTVIDSVRTGLELGYRHIDTAQIYGNEAEVGQAIADSGLDRGSLFVTTKIWTENLSAAALAPSLEASLTRLQLDQVDLTLIHWPSPGDAIPLAESLTALAEAKARGLTRHIGVSNFTLAQLQQAIDLVGADRIASVQIEMHPFLQNRRVARLAGENGIPVTAYMPLAYGKVMHDPVLQRLAVQHDTSPAQVALSWLLQQGFAVIPSSTRREHLQANLQAARVRLSAADSAAIAALERGERLVNPDFAPQWDPDA